MEGKMGKTETRFVGIDLGKRTCEIAIVSRGGKVTMGNGSTTAAGRQKLYQKLRLGDKVALEAGNMAFIMAKEIKATIGCLVYVLNPSRLALIYGSMKKTDKEDALKLAHILEDCKEERLPLVPMPSEQEMKRRKILAGYRRAHQSRNREINRLHAFFVAQGITNKVKKELAEHNLRKEAIMELSDIERKEAEYLVNSLEETDRWIEELEKQMTEESAGDELIERLQTVPGVGPKTSFAFVAHIAADRFANASQVSNYLGFVPRVYMSGDTVRYGGITKRGNGYLRALLVQASWGLIRAKEGGKLKERYEYMTKEKSIGKKQAIVAIARRLSELLYVLMRDGTNYESKAFMGCNTGELAQLALSA